jgi:predicted permease
MPDPRKIYRLLLRLYPARFREEFEVPLERQFADEYRDASNTGARALLWMRALADLAISIPGQIIRELWRDLRYASRVWRRRSLVTALALTALALGIGATTGVFSVLNALLLRSLPFFEPDRLVEIQAPPVNPFQGRGKFYHWRDASTYAQDVAAFAVNDMNLGAGAETARVKTAETSANFFKLMGSEPLFGRSFSPDEDIPGRDGVAVIGYGLWQQLFGGDPRVLGRTIQLNGTVLTVIGVEPPAFDYPAKTVVWTPTAFEMTKVAKAGVLFYKTAGRLKPGVSLARARDMFRAQVESLAPGSLKRRVAGEYVSLVPELIPLREQLAGPVRQASLILMGVVVFVLLIACANVAHLLLSRVAERRQELAIRAALGASRSRLVQQLLTESMLLTLTAAAAGLGIAHWASRLAAVAQPAQLAAQSYTVLDWRVLSFAAGLAVLTGILFGALPAWLMGRMQPSGDPLRCQTGGRGAGANRMRAALIAIQAAFTVVLVAGSFLTGRAFLQLLGTDLGFRTDHVVTLNVSLAGSRHESDHTMRAYYREALDRLRAVPGVESAAAVPYLPLMESSRPGMIFKLDPHHDGPAAPTISATPDYFRTMETAVLEGREFTDADTSSSEPVVVVNEAFARALGIGLHVTGTRLWDWEGKRQFTVAGVVRTARLAGPAIAGSPQVYFPFEQSPPHFTTFVVRVHGTVEPYLAICRDVVRQVDPQVPVYDVQTLDQRLAANLARPRFYTTAIAFFAGFALLLALIGIYGAASYSIAQRTHEIGVRIAVGAAPADVRFMLLRQSMTPLLGGLAVGVAGAASLRLSLNYLISTAPALDLSTCALASALLSVAAGVAVWSATRHILGMNPVSALRVE